MKPGNVFQYGMIIMAMAFSAKAGPLTNVVPITTNLLFSVVSTDSSSTNTSYIFRADEVLYHVLNATSTNHVYYRALDFKETMDFHLFNEAGKEIQKTPRGLDYSRQPTTLPSGRGYFNNLNKFKPQGLGRAGRRLFQPSEMFVITNKGVYEMEIRMRICVNMTTNNMPDYEAISDARKFVRNPDFGVIVSPPVRVKVIKE